MREILFEANRNIEYFLIFSRVIPFQISFLARTKCTDRWYIKNYAQNLNINTCSDDRESIKEGCIYIHRSDIYAVIRKESTEKLF